MSCIQMLQRLAFCSLLALPMTGAMTFLGSEAQAQIVLRQERLKGSGITDRERQRVRESYRRAENFRPTGGASR